MRSPAKIALGTFFLLLLPTSRAENAWKPRAEHMFALDGRTVAGFPSLGKQQHTGIHYRGSLRVQKDPTGILLLKFQNMTYTKFHENLPGGWWSHMNTAREDFRQLPITGSTVAVKLGQHGVETVSLKAGLEDWEINFIQGMVNQLQIDFRTSKPSSKNKRNQINTSYKMMENSVFGRCEVLYEVTRVPRSVALARPDLFPSADKCDNMNFVEIFKTRNFSNCEYRAELHFGLPMSKKCQPGSNACQDFWHRASVTRLSGCGDQRDFRILQSETNSRVVVNLHLHKGSEASVSSYLTMNLMSIKEVSRRFSPHADPVVLRDLKFRFTNVNGDKQEMCSMAEVRGQHFPGDVDGRTQNEDKGRAEGIPFSMDTLNPNGTAPALSNTERNQWDLELLGLHNPPHQPLSPYASKLQGYERSFLHVMKLKETITEIAREFEASRVIYEKMTLEKVMVAVRICRKMTLFDLQRAVIHVNLQSRTNKEQRSESKLYRDVLVMCGTNPAFHILKKWIEEKELKGEDASEVMAAVPAHLQTPGPDIIREFYELMRSWAVREDQQLKITSLLAFSHLLRTACVERTGRHAQYTDETFDATCELYHASHYIAWYTSMLRVDPPLRRVYIAALGNTGAVAALATLQGVAEDMSMSPYLRATAVLAMKYQALRVPEKTSPILLSLYHDVGQAVAVRVAAASLLFYTKPELALLQRVAVLTWYDPSLAVAAFVRSSLVSLANSQDPVFSDLSRYAGMALALVKPVSLGLHMSHNFLWSRVVSGLQDVISIQLSHEASLDATNFYYRFTQRLGGVSRVAFQGDVFVSNPDKFLTMLRELIYPSDDVTQARPAIQNLQRSTKRLRETLKIAPRTLPKLEGDIRVQFGKFAERVFPFDNELPAELAKAGKKLLEQMKTGREFYYQKVDKNEMRTAVLTELGLPVNFQLSVPWAVRLEGKANMNVGNMTFQMDLDMMYTCDMFSELSFHTAWDETVHMAASHGVTVIRIPPTRITAGLSETSAMLLALQIAQAEDGSFIFQHSSRPFTSQHNILDFTIASRRESSSVVHTRRSTQKWNSVIPNVNVNYTTEGPILTPLAWLKNGVNILGHAMMWPSLEASSIAVELDGLNSVNFELRLERGNESLTFPEEALNRSSVQQSVVTTEAPTPPRQQSFWFWNRMRATTAHPDITETTAATSVQVTTEQQSGEHTTVPNMVVLRDTDHDRGSFNVSIINPFSREVNGSLYKYLLVKILGGLHSGDAYVVSLNMIINGTQSRKLSTLWTYAAGRSGKVRRFGLFLKEEKWQVGFTSTLVASAIPVLKLENVIRANITSTIHADLVYTRDNTKYQFSLQTVMGRSALKTESLEDEYLTDKCIDRNQGPETDISPECLRASMEAMFLDRYNMTVTYNEQSKSLGPVMMQHFNSLRYWLLPYITDTEDSTRTFAPSNTITALLEISPSLNTVNAWIRTPSMKTDFSSIPVNPLVTEALRFNPAVSYARRITGESYCGHGGSKFFTFDGVELDYNVTSCWHLLAKDCSGHSRVAVLIRSLNNNETELEVNMDNYQILRLRPGLNASANEKPVELAGHAVVQIADQAGALLAHLQALDTPERIISVALPAHGFHIIYTGSSTLIMADRSMRGRLCGICGDFDGDTVKELRKPQDTQAHNGQEYASSYAITGQPECASGQIKYERNY